MENGKRMMRMQGATQGEEETMLAGISLELE